ncbi:DUF3667 domain-containing protein [Duganella sp. CY15W]|uniref:DUF3667 domain-containing protein n=1 Tax=Duganella sp. CY15W TaxID=2692172 RepID=UPI001369EB69|nr:DUF3667 domain-containing protein [Duganella sp. CY15W]MYM29816.1 DUF3667 domain-containing protein [Duganella sp. CY15W]
MSTAAAPDNCANCETPLNGHYCSHCGQEAVLHHASTREFLHEFIGHYVALEGKLWGSLKRLILNPGELTNEYIRGRRVRYVQPLRLYLTFSVLFFALLKFTGGESDGKVDIEGTTAKVMAPVSELAQNVGKQQGRLDKLDPAAAQSKAAAEAALADMVKEMREEDDKSAARLAEVEKHPAAKVVHPAAEAKKDSKDSDNISEEYIERKLMGWPLLQHQWQIFNTLPADEQLKTFKNAMHHYAPYAIFMLMPVFALFLKVLYLGSGRRFGEHMLFALHTNAFAFLIFSLILVVNFGLVQFVLWCWLIGYLPWAMRRVYHSSRLGTFLRWSVLMLLYMLAMGLALMFSSLFMGILTVGH